MMIQCGVVHGIPGRVRLRMPILQRHPDLAAAVKNWLRDQAGITDVRLNRGCASLIVNYDPACWTPETLQQFVAGLQPEKVQAYRPNSRPRSAEPAESSPRPWLPLALSSSAIALSLTAEPLAPLALSLMIGSALPICRRAFTALFHRRKLNIDVLDASATGILILQSQWPTAAFMVWLVNLADYIRDLTMARSQRAINSVLDYQKQPAWVLRDGKKSQIPISEIEVGDIVIVYPGARIPVDGEVISGKALVDQQILTGESMPIEKNRGDLVYAATTIQDGKLYIRTEYCADETEAVKITRLINGGPPHETRIQNYAERWADALVPYSFAGAGASTLVTRSASRAASLLIIDYGTGIRVAAPTTVLASLGRAARSGILIKGGRSLEQLAEIDALVFDKTGTLTNGTPEIVQIMPHHHQFTTAEILTLAAAAEQRLTHPLAQAIVRAAEARGIPIPERSSSDYTIGLGVDAAVNGYRVLVGSRRFMEHKQVNMPPRARRSLERFIARGTSPLCVALDGQLIGTIALADSPRLEASGVIRALEKQGIRKIVLLTGDHKSVAKDTAQKLGISTYIAEVFPEEKVEVVKQLQQEGYRVGIVGDGINDSPALAQADVGIAVGWGTDVAQETAQVVLMEGNLWKLPLAVEIAKESMSLVRQGWNLIWIPNTLALGMTFLGLLNPVGATIISNGSSILAGLNSLRPLLHNGTGNSAGHNSSNQS